VLHAELRRVLNLLIVAAERSNQASRRHGAGNANFALTTDFGPRY